MEEYVKREIRWGVSTLSALFVMAMTHGCDFFVFRTIRRSRILEIFKFSLVEIFFFDSDFHAEHVRSGGHIPVCVEDTLCLLVGS